MSVVSLTANDTKCFPVVKGLRISRGKSESMADEISQLLGSSRVEFCALFEKWDVDGLVGARRSIGRAKNPEVGSSTVSLAFPRISPPA